MGETHVWETKRDAVRSITNIYSLVYTLQCTRDDALTGEVRLQGSSTVLPTTVEIVTELSETM